MAEGPGKYDHWCSRIRMEEDGAHGVIVVVIGPPGKNGFSVQLPVELQRRVPAIMRVVADQIEEGQG